MWRMAFLLLVVFGALALIIGAIFGVGMWQVARLQAANQAEIAAATQQSAQASRPPAPPSPVPSKTTPDPSVDALVNGAPRVRPPAGPDAGWPPPDPARGGRLPVAADPPQAGAPGADNPVIVLDVKSAVIHGDDLRLACEPKTAVNWKTLSDALTWSLNAPKPGYYDVEIEYACDPREGGGVFWLQSGRFPLRGAVPPTGGWQDFRTVLIGQIIVLNNETDVVFRPLYLQADHQLMSLRSVKLTLKIPLGEGRREFRRMGRLGDDRGRVFPDP